jgi:uncharacterized protein (TIGR02996 family)
VGERNAFVRGIVEQPADDNRRLVFADWLDEHDEPEHAAHLRHDGLIWNIVSAKTVSLVFGTAYPVEARRRYLVRWPAAGPRIRAEDRSPTCILGPIASSFPRAWGVRCHCGSSYGWIEFTGGTWHCPTCPPTEAERERWQNELNRRLADVMERLLQPQGETGSTEDQPAQGG